LTTNCTFPTNFLEMLPTKRRKEEEEEEEGKKKQQSNQSKQ
jgi:hypothetical protein